MDVLGKEVNMVKVVMTILVIIIITTLGSLIGEMFPALTHANTGRSDMYTNTYRYATRMMYENIRACGCDLVIIDNSEMWSEDDDILLYVVNVHLSGGIGKSDHPRRVMLEVKYFKKSKSYASKWIDLTNPPKINLEITGAAKND